jgi:hypothetical protein
MKAGECFMKCIQCGKPGIIEYEFGLLCVDCNLKLQQANDIAVGNLERQANFFMDEMEMVSGVPLGGGRYPERKPPIVHTGDMNIRPIVLNNSVVGNINQGIVQNLNASLKNITIVNQSYARDIKDFIEKVAEDQVLVQEEKEEVAEKVEFLTQQLQSQNKNKSVIKTIVSSINTIVAISSGLATVWTALSPIFLKP